MNDHAVLAALLRSDLPLFHLEELPDHIAGHTLSAELAYRRHRLPTDARAGGRDLPAPHQSAAALA